MKMKVYTLALLVASTTCVIFFTSTLMTRADAELKGTAADLVAMLTNAPRTASILGEAETKVQADQVIITVRISVTARELGQAIRMNEQARSKFAELLTKRGLVASAVQTSRFSSTEKSSIFSDKARSHRVDNLLKVMVKNENEFQIVADATDALPEAHYVGLDFKRSDEEQVKTQAIAKACDNAEAQKKIFEQKLGVRLTPRGFGGVPSAYPYSYSRAGSARAVGFEAPTVTTMSGVTTAPSFVGKDAASGQREDDTSGFGELTFRAQVVIEYLVER